MKIYLECTVSLYHADKPVTYEKYRRAWHSDIPPTDDCKIWPLTSVDDPGGKYAMSVSVLHVHIAEGITVVKLYSREVLRCTNAAESDNLDAKLRAAGWMPWRPIGYTAPELKKEGQA